MAHSKPKQPAPATPVDPNAPVDPKAPVKSDEQAKQDEAVKWYTDVLGFPEASAKALYIDQTLTDEEVLITLTDKTVDAVRGAVCKPGGTSNGEPTPIGH